MSGRRLSGGAIGAGGAKALEELLRKVRCEVNGILTVAAQNTDLALFEIRGS